MKLAVTDLALRRLGLRYELITSVSHASIVLVAAPAEARVVPVSDCKPARDEHRQDDEDGEAHQDHGLRYGFDVGQIHVIRAINARPE